MELKLQEREQEVKREAAKAREEQRAEYEQEVSGHLFDHFYTIC